MSEEILSVYVILCIHAVYIEYDSQCLKEILQLQTTDTIPLLVDGTNPANAQSLPSLKQGLISC
jgi:hypothetical protein